MGQPSDAELEQYRRKFNHFDKDGNGKLHKQDIGKLFRACGFNPSKAEIKEKMRKMDGNHDGELSFSEFVSMIHNRSEVTDDEMLEIFRQFDKQGRGYLDAKQFREMLATEGEPLSHAEIDDMFRDFDVDGDGRIDLGYALDAMYAESEESDSDDELFEDRGRRKPINPKNLRNPQDAEDAGIKVMSRQELEDDDLFDMEEAEEGEQFMAVKPWLGAIVEPSRAPRNNPRKPDESLALDWVYGYRCHDSHSNLVANSKGHFVYPAAGVVIAYDPKRHMQTHFRGHNDDVICLAQHPNKPDIVATGQVATIIDGRATLPHVCVWNSVTGDEWTLPKFHKRAVRTLAFSSDGRYLATVGEDDNFHVAVWDWERKKLIASEKSGVNKIYQLKWNPAPGHEAEFCTVGVKHVFFWTLEDRKLRKKRGQCGKKMPLQTFFDVDYHPKGYALVAAKDGTIGAFVGGRAKKCSKKLHKGGIFSIVAHKDGVLTGGRDGRVVFLDTKLQPIGDIQFRAKIRSMRIVGNGKDLLVGTAKSQVFLVKRFAPDADIGKPFVEGHYNGELWGLASHPRDSNIFATAGEDNTIALWDGKKHRQLRSTIISREKGKRMKHRKAATTSTEPMNRCARAACFSPDGQHLAIGTNEGHVKIVHADTLKPVASIDLNRHGKRNVKNQTGNWIAAMQYSPDGRCLAVGTHGSVICLLSVRKNYKVGGTLTKHNAAVSHLDWSEDSEFLQSNCIGYELLFWSVDTSNPKQNDHVTNATSMRDVRWATQTCILGWPVQGIFDPSQDGTDINMVARSPSGALLATADDYGNVNLFRYPCIEQTNDKRSYSAHSSHVANVRWSRDDKTLFSTGGGDKTIMQWCVE